MRKSRKQAPPFLGHKSNFSMADLSRKCPEFGIVVVLKYISVKKEDKKQFGGL